MPVFDPFSCHWYTGAPPPFVGVAVKSTLSPEHIGLALAAITILAAKDEVTEIVMALDVPCVPAEHPEEEVMIHVIVSPSFNVTVE